MAAEEPPNILNTNARKRLIRALEGRLLEFLDQTDFDQIPVQERDNGKYSILKYTILPKGTRLRFRSHAAIGSLQNRPIWADYSHLLGKKSFLDEEEDYSKGMEHYFGKYMNTVELLEDMTIIHFPVNYDTITAPNVYGRHSNGFNWTRRRLKGSKRRNRITKPASITAEIEGYVQMLCVFGSRKNPRYFKAAEKFKDYDLSICRDGYTMDFFYRFGGSSAKFFKAIQERLRPKMAGFREICLTNVSPRTVRLVESVYKPVGEAGASGAVAESKKPE